MSIPSELSFADTFIRDQCHLRIPSAPDWVEPTAEYLMQRAKHWGVVTEVTSYRLVTVLHEALTNAIIHGNLEISSELKEQDDDGFMRQVALRCADPNYSRRVVDIRALFEGKSARWVISDQGAGFDHAAILRRLDAGEYDPLKPSGRGLMLIRAFVDEMSYEDNGRRLILTIHPSWEEEKRGQERVPMTRGVRVAPIDAEGRIDWLQGHEALMRNVSTTGISLLQDQGVETRRVLITISTGGEPVAVPAEIRHWREVAEGVVEVGCSFQKPISLHSLGIPSSEQRQESAIHRLVRRLVDRAPPGERRLAPRVIYHEPIEIERPGVASIRGFARDLSRSGISFFTSLPVPLDPVTLSLPMGDDSTARVTARIVRCTQLIDGFYDIAARFGGMDVS